MNDEWQTTCGIHDYRPEAIARRDNRDVCPECERYREATGIHREMTMEERIRRPNPKKATRTARQWRSDCFPHYKRNAQQRKVSARRLQMALPLGELHSGPTQHAE